MFIEEIKQKQARITPKFIVFISIYRYIFNISVFLCLCKRLNDFSYKHIKLGTKNLKQTSRIPKHIEKSGTILLEPV